LIAGPTTSVERPAARTSEGARLVLCAIDDGRLLCGRVAIAGSFAARSVGLIGRRGLDPDEGLYLPGTSSIHMLFMRFPIDCLFLSRPAADGSRRVTAVRHGLKPWRGVVWHVRRTEGVIELAAGTLARNGTQVGDVVRLERSVTS
jgi:uncharacterized protein